MALTVGTNSYISREDANSYFADRLNSSTWTSSTDSNKDAALIQATKMIDTKNYLGHKSLYTQVLKFPRYGLEYDGYVYAGAVTPQQVLDATCEFAIWLLTEDYTTPNDLADFSMVQIGPIQVDTRAGTSYGKQFPPLVTSLLSPFLDSSTRLVRG